MFVRENGRENRKKVVGGERAIIGGESKGSISGMDDGPNFGNILYGVGGEYGAEFGGGEEGRARGRGFEWDFFGF